MELEVRHLRALCAIADAGSVRKAARQLGMTQPSLTAQLRRIENALGGQLFFRERTGSRPTPLGHSVLSRARPIVADMRALVDEIASASLRAGGSRLRIGSTSSRAVAGWLRRLRARLPDTETTIRIDVSANALLQMVAMGQLDVAFVHEVEGAPLRRPDGLVERELLAREPQFVALPVNHPAARRPVVELADLADDQWMVDPSVDGEWTGLRRVFAAAGLDPRVVHGDYLTAADLVAAGEVVTPCQPTSPPRTWRWPGRARRTGSGWCATMGRCRSGCERGRAPWRPPPSPSSGGHAHGFDFFREPSGGFLTGHDNYRPCSDREP
ncbi:LysR family transcriptional regulator [Streptomyces sp. WAC 06725]|uniref:LysR family transcriptional regulator n=1 Tax=Streptomyces sp. WAC 06725 TaxID=2203209 RepID=UPI0037D9DBFA